MLKHKLIFLLCAVCVFVPAASVLAGTVSSSHKYAWSDNVGYINFEHVIVNANTLSGYAWSANAGFIKFDPAAGGVINDGSGNLSGSAWGGQLGWIDFSGVRIDASGKFSGTASGSLAGTITFDCPLYCNVTTDWRPAAASSPQASAGGGVTLIPSSTKSTIPPTNFTAFTPLQAQKQDIIQDGIYNIIDFNAMMVNWKKQEADNAADINGDGTVDIFDFNLLMVLWGTTYKI